MVILSQDKQKIINFENLSEIYVTRYSSYPYKNDEEECYSLRSATPNGEYENLGKYATEERAKEVLLEIVTYNANFNLFKYSDAKRQNITSKVFLDNDIIFDVFEMPEE